MKSDTLNVVRASLQGAAIGIKLLVIVEQNIRLQHGRAGIAVIGDGQRVRSKILAKNRARKSHGVNAVSGSNRRSRVHHSTELNAAQHLIPHVESGSCGRVPGRIPIRKRAVRIAQLELHHRAPAAGPFWSFKRITARTSPKKCRDADRKNGCKLRQ